MQAQHHDFDKMIKPVAVFKSPYGSKFGIPRQSGLTEAVTGGIVFLPPYNDPNAIRGIADFDYLWLIWGFSANEPQPSATREADNNNETAKASTDETDSRNLHRGMFDWQRAENRINPDTPQGRLFQGLRRLVQVRRENPAFAVNAVCHTIDLPSPSLLGLVREAEGQTLCALFNCGDEPAGIHLPWAENTIDLLSGETPSDVLPAGGFVWMAEKTH